MPPPFHLSIPVNDIERAKKFYVESIGCSVGREGKKRFDVNFFGHHIVAHLLPEEADRDVGGIVSGGDKAPVRHFGVVLPLEQWQEVADRLTQAGADFVVEPHTSKEGTVAAQHIMLAKDGCGNVVEFKSMPPERLFARE